MLNVLDLFSGIGNLSHGLRCAGGFQTKAFCEIDSTCWPVLEKHWPGVPIYADVRTPFKFGLPFRPDVVCGGFPCQDISLNGAGAGLDGERSGLWREYLRIVEEVEPSWVIVENVTALRARGLEEVLRGLSSLGYFARWDCLPSTALGSDQERDRIWLVANRSSERIQGMWSEGLPEPHTLAQPFVPLRGGDGQWQVEPDLRRSAYGNGSRLDGRMNTWGQRLHQIGNAVDPRVAEAIGREILRVEAACSM